MTLTNPEKSKLINEPPWPQFLAQMDGLVHSDSQFGPLTREAFSPLLQNREEIYPQLTKTLQQAMVSRDLVHQLAITLNHQYFKFEASDLLLEYQPLWPNDLDFLKDVIESCVVTGRAFRGEQLITRWHQLTEIPNRHEVILKRWAEFYRRQILTEMEIQPLLETGLSLIRQALKHPPQNTLVEVGYANYDGYPYLSYTIHSDLPVDELLVLEEQHIQLLLTGDFTSRLLNSIIITFEPYPAGAAGETGAHG